MKIGIDARLFGPKFGGGGLGRYVEELVKHIEAADRENEYVIFLRRENWNEYEPQHPNFKKALAPWRWYTLGEQFGMPRLAKKTKVDILHIPHFNVPIFSSMPYVATIHDLILFDYPSIKASRLSPIFFWIKFFGYRIVLWFALHRARKIIAVSHATADALKSRFKITDEKIKMIYSGFTPLENTNNLRQEYEFKNCNLIQQPLNTKTDSSLTGFTSPNTSNQATEDNILRQIDKPYVLSVGNAYPHKNLDSLLCAFRDIINEQNDVLLIITGPDDSFRQKLKKISQELNIDKHVIFTGFVSEVTLDNLYRNARAYIVPSFVEGFGFPGLEAQMRGVPVLASDIPAHRETFGDGALFFDPKDIQSIKNAIHKILTDDILKDNLRQSGLKNYKRFSWDKAAAETISVYNHVFGL